MSVIVSLALATICFMKNDIETCHPVLIGGDTPRGEFTLQQRLVESPGYGGDVLQFKEDKHEIYAIHRVWTLRPWEKRAERLKSKDPKQRRITKGCINIDPTVYEELLDCCSNQKLVIK
jgi:hypothetical protein